MMAATAFGQRECAPAAMLPGVFGRAWPSACFGGSPRIVFLHAVNSSAVVRHIFVSPGHNFFGRFGGPPGAHTATDVASVLCRAGLGLEGDRFFGYRPDYNGQITFFSWEIVEGLRRAFGVPELSADVVRRNVVIEGVHLNDLIGVRFRLGGIEFEGMGEARPCAWMNGAVAPGAEGWLRGRGGLRAKIRSDGVLVRGPVELQAPNLLAL
jgi:hypothetical protein